MAIDFSGTDSFLKNINDTTILEFTSTEYIKKPLQPAFNAYGVTGTTQGNYVVFPSVNFDNNSNYNTTNGRFTAPVAGTYYFYYHQITNNGLEGEYRVVLYKNATWYSGSCYITRKAASAYQSLYLSQHVYLNAGDYVNIMLNTAPAAMYSGAGDTKYGQFSGYLVG